MAIQQQLDQQLSRIPAGGKLALTLPEGTWEADIARCDALGVAFNSFVFSTDRLANAETALLSKIADTLATKLRYLLEPLRVIEIDGQAGAVQMRSAPPYKQDQIRTYYEVLVQRGGNISLVRYEKQPGQARTPIAAVVTREVFYRLAEDLRDAVP